MKRFLAKLAITLVCLAALGYLLFPIGSDQYAQYQAAPQIEKFQSQIKTLNQAGKANIREEWTAINARIAGGEGGAVQPQTVNGLLGVLEIPAIQLRLPVYSPDKADALDTGLTVQAESALPTGEEGTHTVLIGKNGRLADGDLGYFGLYASQLLRRIDRVKPGDMMYLYTPLGVQAYRAAEAEALNADGGAGPVLTVTATDSQTPKAVSGLWTPIQEGAAEGNGVTVPADWVNILIIGSPVLLVGLVFMWLVERFRSPHYRLPVNKKMLKKR